MKYMRQGAVAAGPKIRSKYELDGIIEVWYMVYGIIEVCQYNVKCIMYNKIRSKYELDGIIEVWRAKSDR